MSDMLRVADRRLRRLERDNAKTRTVEVASQWIKEFQAVPTCPPTTAVQILQGKMWTNAGWWAWISYNCRIETLVADFADPVGSEMYSATGVLLDLTFDNANWYQSLILGLNSDWVFYRDDPGTYDDGIFWARGAGTDYETPAEAEANIDAILNGTATVLPGGTYPLYAFVLRNDGRTGVNGAVLPVDLLNRGRSYIYRDVRPRNRITA